MKLIYAIFFALAISHTHANTPVWKVSKGNDYFYIGGTIHLLNQEDYPLPKAFNQAYQDSDTLIFETDIDASNQPEQQAKMMTSMMYTDARTLSSELSPEVYTELKAFLAARQIPISHFEKYQPWGLSIILTVMEYQRLGMVSELGVDQHFNVQGKADKKTIGSLETIDEQLGFLQSLADINPDVIIRYTIEDMKSLPKWILIMKQAWRDGDIHAFTDMQPVIEMQTQFPKVYDTLITNRNNNWMKQIPSLINNKQKEFVLVGTLHLNDEIGLLNQLRNKGFKIEQL
ncbi:TraB/GumN family protein [Oceaniserpentilla sp. 4NH20-0058]|uniref:TraB/GumN family protein n=1 Tax=Oceaniserpentilla sp. 4NH20-0058 TaxID=3127660 RepID=UPI00310A9752